MRDELAVDASFRGGCGASVQAACCNCYEIQMSNGKTPICPAAFSQTQTDGSTDTRVDAISHVVGEHIIC